MNLKRARLIGAVIAMAVAATSSIALVGAPVAGAVGPTTVAGVVTDAATGEPIAGVEVDVVIGSSLSGGATEVATAVTDASGGYTISLAGLATAADPVTVDLVDSAGAFGASYANAVPLVDDDTVFAPFALSAGGRVSGAVTGVGAGPLAGACVTVRNTATQLVVPAGLPGSCTDASGAYALPALAAGTYTLTFASPDAAAWQSIPAQQVTVVAGSPAVADASLLAVRTTSITGVVTELGTDAPLAGMDVTATATDTAGAPQTLTATTDATGAFTLPIGFQPGSPFSIDVVDRTGAHHPALGITISVQAGYTEAIGVKLQSSDLLPTTNVTLSGPPTTIIDGHPGAADIVVTNAGPTVAANVIVTATLPPFATAGEVQAPAGFDCSVAGQVLTCSAASLGVQRQATIRIPLTTGPSPLFGFIMSTVTTTSIDANPFDNNVSQFLSVQPDRSDVRVLFDARPLEVGVSAPVTLGAFNFGPATANDVFVAARFPASFTIDRVDARGWTCAVDGQEVGCSVASLAPERPFEALVYVTPSEIATGVAASAIAGAAGIATDAVDTRFDVVPVGSVDLTVFATPFFRGPLVAGRVENLEFDVANAGPAAAIDAVFDTDIPAGLEVVGASDITGELSCAITGQHVTCTSPALRRGANARVQIGVRPAVIGGPFSVTATVRSSSVDIGTRPDTSTMPDFVVIPDEADLSVSVSPPPLAIGDVGTISVRVGNLGPARATDVDVTAVVPEGFAIVSARPSFFGVTCSIASRTVTCRFPELFPTGFPFTVLQVGVIPAAAATGEMSASVSSPSTDPQPADNTTTATLNAVAPGADLRVSVGTFLSPPVGQTGSLFVSVVNEGPSAAAGTTATVSVPEPFRLLSVGFGAVCTVTDHLATCDLGDVPPAFATSFFLNFVADAPGQASIAAAVSSLTPDPDPADNEMSIVLSASEPAADLTVFVPFGQSLVAGEPNERTVSIQNNSFNAASDVIVTVAATDASLTAIAAPGFDCSVEPDGTGRCTAATFGPFQFVGATVTFVPAVDSTSVLLTAAISASTNDPSPFNNQSSTTLSVVPAGTADVSARLVIGDTGFALGVQRDVTVGVFNAGPGRVAAASFVFDAPSGFEVTGVAAGVGATCSFDAVRATCDAPNLTAGSTVTARVTLLPVALTSTFLTVTVSGAANDLVPFNDLAGEFVFVSPNESDLYASTFPTTAVAVGGETSVQVSVNNAGPASATDATLEVVYTPELALVSSSLPPECAETDARVITCAYAFVPRFSGTFATLRFTALSETPGATVTATVTASTPDPFPSNNQFVASIPIAPAGAVDMRFEQPPFVFGAEIGQPRDVLMSVRHIGPATDPATDVHVRAEFPDQVRVDSAAPSFFSPDGTCTVDANVVDCVFPSVAFATSAYVLVTITPLAAVAGAPIPARVDAAAFDPEPGNNAFTGFLEVLPDEASLSIGYTQPGRLIEGDITQQQVDVFNSGPSSARNVSLRIEPSAGLTVTDPVVFNAAAPCEADGAAWTCPLGGVFRFSSARISYTLTGTATGPASITFTAAADNQPAPGTVSLAVPIEVVPVGTADLGVSVSSFSTDPSGGQSVFVSYGQSGPTLAVENVVLRVDTPGLQPGDAFTFGFDVSCVTEIEVLVCTIPRLQWFSGGFLSFSATPVRDEFGAQITATISGPGFDPFLDNNTSRSFLYDARVTPSAPTIAYVLPRDQSVEMGLGSPQFRNQGISDYVVEASTDGGVTWRAATDPGPSDEPPIGFDVTGLRNGVSYVFRVAAVNAFGRGDWSEISAPVTPSLPPRTPSNLEARAGNRQVTLTWRAPSQRGRNPIFDYVIEYSTDRGRSWTQYDDGFSTATRTVVTDLTNGTRYLFRVAAVNDAGQSRFSEPTGSVTPRAR